MANIELLDNATIDKIAAGEVVENPASIVKELVENAMDSGANSITVEIKNGGIEFIRVTDNGSGITKENIKKAFLRHATSKISSIEDLFIIKSMGFRGEALASISSVAKVELISKTSDSLMGNRYLIEGSKEISFEEIGAPDGTTIIVRNLFYNTPARRKFLKSETTEANYISELLQNLSLCRPDISFSYIVNGKQKLSTSGNNDLKEIIYRLYGRDIIDEIIPIEIEKDGLRVKGYLGEPSQNRSTRNYETYFINNRLIKSKVISNSIENGYKAYTMQHKFPFCVLHFSMDTMDIDINVHPQKKEVRFNKEDLVSGFISSAIEDTLHDNEMIANISLSENSKEKSTIEKEPEPFEILRKDSVINRTDIIEESSDETPNEDNEFDNFNNGYIEDIPLSNDDEEDFELDEETDSKSEIALSIEKSKKLYNEIVVESSKQQELFEDERFFSHNSRKDYNIIGQIFNTYWIIVFKDKIYYIDQHAAHEKVNYERLVKRVKDNHVESQYLNPPVIVTLSPSEKTILMENIEYFCNLGFEIEDMGINEVGLRATPIELYFNNPKDMFTDIIAELSKFNTKDTPDVITNRIATMACKASVKGGMELTRAEAEHLIDELLTLDNPYHCPHGRPTIFAMSKYELEKKFKRIVD